MRFLHLPRTTSKQEVPLPRLGSPTSYRFNTPAYDGGTCITTPAFTIDGKDYFVVGDTIEFSELHTFGSTAAGKMWQFVARTSDNVYQTLLATDYGIWMLPMLDKEMIIATYRPASLFAVSNVQSGGAGIGGGGGASSSEGQRSRQYDN